MQPKTDSSTCLCILFLFLLFPLIGQAEVGYIEPWGQDANLVHCLESKVAPEQKKLSLAARFAEQMILFHHRVLTHIDGPRSHFRPTSSQYALLAIRKYGFVKGFIMGCDRLLRENEDPWVYRTKLIHGTMYKWDPLE